MVVFTLNSLVFYEKYVWVGSAKSKLVLANTDFSLLKIFPQIYNAKTL